MLNVKLLVVGGEVDSAEFALKLPAVVGRSREVEVNLTHPLVSRRHCELREVGGKLVVRDLGSLNGTFVGSDRVEEAVLRPGELLTVGTVTFRAIYEMPVEAFDAPLKIKPNATPQISGVETVRHLPQQDTETLRRDPRPVRIDLPAEIVPNSPHMPPVEAPR
jgi:predicted component of type VI protein secretion system